MSDRGIEHRQIVEIGGPGGIRLGSSSSALGSTPSPAHSPSFGGVLTLAAGHPRASALVLGLVGTGLLVGPLAFVLALGLPWGLLVGPAVLALGLFGASAFVARGALQRLQRARRQPALERELLELAGTTRGRLTVPLVARHLSVSLAEAEHLLTSLARAGHVDVDVDPGTGALSYILEA